MILPAFASGRGPARLARLLRLEEELLGIVDGYGEGDAGRHLHAVDPDRLSVQVYQRTT